MRSSREQKPTLLWSPHAAGQFAIGTSDKLSIYAFQHGPAAGDEVDFDGPRSRNHCSRLPPPCDHPRRTPSRAHRPQRPSLLHRLAPAEVAARLSAGAPADDSVGLESLAPRRSEQSVRPVSSVSDVSQLTCATWSPRADQPLTIAIGTATGRMVLHECTPRSAAAAEAPPVRPRVASGGSARDGVSASDSPANSLPNRCAACVCLASAAAVRAQRL